MKSIFHILIIFFISYSSLSSQPLVDIINIRYNYFTKTTYQDRSDCANQSNQYTAELFFPVELKPGKVLNFFLVGADCNYLCFHLDNSFNRYQKKLVTTSLQVGGIKNIGKSRWNTMLLAIPRISSNYLELKSNDWQMGGVVLFTYKVKAKLKLKIGLYYNREFFGNYWMPLAGIDWKMGKKAYLFGVLPSNFNFEYKLSEKFYTGIQFRNNIGSYRIGDQHGNYYIREGDPFWGDNQLYGIFNYYPFKHIAVFAAAGVTGYRYFQQYNSGNKKETTIAAYQKMKDQILIQVGLAYRIRLDKDYFN